MICPPRGSVLIQMHRGAQATPGQVCGRSDGVGKRMQNHALCVCMEKKKKNSGVFGDFCGATCWPEPCAGGYKSSSVQGYIFPDYPSAKPRQD